MSTMEIAINFLINIAGYIAVFCVGFFFRLIPKSINKYRMRKFFGKSVFNNSFGIVYGTLQDPRPRCDNTGNLNLRFQKRMPSGELYNLTGPFDNIVGECEIRASGYLIQNIGKGRETTIKVIADNVAYKDINSTFIALGSPASNIISGITMRDENNIFYQFDPKGSGRFIESISGEKRYVGFQNPDRKDKALIMKLRNERFPEHYLFVCAGLGEWGTSGASWYLANHWKELYKEFKTKNFAIIVEVDLNSDTSAKRIDNN